MKQCKHMTADVFDNKRYRLNVGMVVVNQRGQLFWGRRSDLPDAWQFPQGGLLVGETPQEALYRELQEELGLPPEAVELLYEMPQWLSYPLPKRLQQYGSKPFCLGQRQKWFLLRLLADDQEIRLDYSPKPEFDEWCWVDYWYPLKHVVAFKRNVYQKVLTSFENLI